MERGWRAGGRTPAPTHMDHDIPAVPLPDPGEGGPVWPGVADTPEIPLPRPGEGGPVWPGDADTPEIPLPRPGEGGPVWPGDSGSDDAGIPSVPLPEPGEGGPVWPGLQRPLRYAKIRFLNAAAGRRPLRILLGRSRIASALSFAAFTPWRPAIPGYRTVTVLAQDGTVLLQRGLPFPADGVYTVAVVPTARGLDLVQISDACCRSGGGWSSLRVCALAYDAPPLDVLLGDGRVVFADVRFKEVTSFRRVWPGSYQFWFAAADLPAMPMGMDVETMDPAFLGAADPLTNSFAALRLDVARRTDYTLYLLRDGGGGIQVLPAERRS